MEKTEDLYKALATKDPRYDGRFYFGVKTTGIYCRPICFAKPKKRNVLFYRSPAEAEKAGYRPCLRCRPDISPTSPQWEGTAAVVSRALRLLNDSDPSEISVPFLSERLGLSDRHLRRLFEEHLGVSPIEIAISRRLHLARLLLSQTQMGITDVAFAAGFGSLRRFNDAFLKTYKKNPRDFRKENLLQEISNENTLNISLSYIAPYDWEHLIGFLKHHGTYGVDTVSDDTYKRHGYIGKDYFQISVKNKPSVNQLQIAIQIPQLKVLRPLIERLRHLFDIDHNPHQIQHDLHLLKDAGGIRVPGAFDPFETAVSVILGQLVSVEQGRKNVRKLVETFGSKLKTSTQAYLTHTFPSASILAKVDVSVIGIPQARASAIQELARSFSLGTLDLSSHCDLQQTRKSLLAIKGIGPWTVEMIAMRCLRDPNAYPETDLILKRAQKLHKLSTEELSPWRAYAAIGLWKRFAKELSRPGQKRKVKK